MLGGVGSIKTQGNEAIICVCNEQRSTEPPLETTRLEDKATSIRLTQDSSEEIATE